METRRPELGPAAEDYVPPPPLIAPAPCQPIGTGTLLFIVFIPIQTVRTQFHWMGSCVTMATAERMSNTTSDSLTTELSRTVVPCALKNNSWLVYN